jgi:predicted RNA-binding protein YlqC (UPF0109 family)
MTDVTGEDTEGEADTDTDTDTDTDAGGPAEAALPKAVLTYLATQIVDEPDGVVVEVDERRNGVELSLHVAPDDMGKIIGRRGRVAQAIRTVVRAAGAKAGIDAQVEIVD